LHIKDKSKKENQGVNIIGEMNNDTKIKRNNTLNFFKGLACFAIVWMHTNSGGLVNQVVVCMARFGIPVFFMVSGYFTYKNNKVDYTKVLAKKIIHIVKLIVVATLVYIIWQWVVDPLIKTGYVPNVFNSMERSVGGLNVFNILVLNINPFSGILWFLNALLYCYLIWLIIAKVKNKHVIYILAIVILFIGIFTRAFIQYNHTIPEEININYFRNWFFMGLPFFTIGYFIHDYQERIVKIAKPKYMVVAAIIGMVMSFAERLVVPLEVFVGTVIVSVALFIFSVEKPDLIKIPIINRVGERFCFFIYIAHIIVRDIVLVIFDRAGINNKVVLWIMPIIVFALCYILAMCYYAISDKIKSSITE